jgi:hypothetical protein
MTNDLDRDLRDMFRRHETDLLGRGGTSPPNVVQRVRSRQIRNALVVGLVAVVIAVGATTGLGALLRADKLQPADTRPTPRPIPPEALVIPPPGAEPSSPETGELVMQFIAQNIEPCSWCEWYLYADGRLVTFLDEPWERFAGGFIVAWVEQRLTPQGVELMRDELRSSSRLQPGRGSDAYNYFSVRLSDGGPIRSVGWSSQDRGPDRCSGAICYGFDDAVFARMRDPASWLPASAWADARIRPYVPSRYVVYGDPIVHPAALPPPADTILDAVECQVISTNEARELLDRFHAAGLLSTEEPLSPSGIDVRYERNRGVGYVHFGPALPDTSC